MYLNNIDQYKHLREKDSLIEYIIFMKLKEEWYINFKWNITKFDYDIITNYIIK